MNFFLVLLVIGMIALPLAFIKGEYGGTDDAAKQAIDTVNPDYKPWFHSIMAPPSSEVESLLFALQAGIGAGVIGYVIGYYKGRSAQGSKRDDHES